MKFFFICIISLSFLSCEELTNSSNFEVQNAFTESMYDQVRTGMSYSEVVKIMGEEGSLEFQATNPAIEGYSKETNDKIYMWRNSQTSFITITFKDGNVEQKMQSLN